MEQLCISFWVFFPAANGKGIWLPLHHGKAKSCLQGEHLRICAVSIHSGNSVFLNLHGIWLRSRQSAFWIIRSKHNVQAKFNWGRTFFLRTLIAYPPSSTYLPSLQMLTVAFELVPLQYQVVRYSSACFGWQLSCVTWTPCCGCQRTVICQGMISCG